MHAVDRDGLPSPDESEYFVRVLTNHLPSVAIVRPEGDREITALEEVAIEVRAEDDYGLERVELVYAVVGRPERTVELAGQSRPATVNGRHTIFAEELELVPGDVMSFYARARDADADRSTREARSDIYFLQVRRVQP